MTGPPDDEPARTAFHGWSGVGASVVKVAHLTTVDVSLRYLLLPQLTEVRDLGGEILGISAPGHAVSFLESHGVRHIPLESSTRSFSLFADLSAARELWGVLRRERVDVLHTHNPKPGFYGRVLGRLSRVPIIVNTVHGFYATETDGFARRFIVYVMEAIAAMFSDGELFQSREDMEMADRLHIGRRSRRGYLGNGVDLTRFRPEIGTSTRARVRGELGIHADSRVVGCVARLVAEKGIPELLDAHASRAGDYELIVIGPFDPTKADAIAPSIVEDARRRGVHFLGHRDDVEDLYHAFDLFVLPSHREGFPRAAMEAAASGLAIVATDIRGCRDVVEDGVNGYLTPVLDPESLAVTIEKVLADPATLAEMGVASRRKAEAEFDEREIVRKVISSYRDIADEKGLTEIEHALADPLEMNERGDE